MDKDEYAQFENDDEDDEERRDDVSAGLVRAAARQARSILRVFARADIGSLPRKVPARRIVTLTDRLSTTLDVWGSYKAGVGQVDSAGPPAPALRPSPFRTAARRRLLALLHAVPPFISSTILGTVLFGAYEELHNRIAALAAEKSAAENGRDAESGGIGTATAAIPGNNKGDETSGSGTTASIAVFPATTAARAAAATTGTAMAALAAAAGGTAGAAHGTLYWIFNSVGARAFQPHLPGTMASHALAHGALFGGYEGVKTVLLRTLETDRTQASGAAAVFAAGGFAGALQETVAFYSSRLERHGLRGLWAALRHGGGGGVGIGRPALGAVAAAAPGAGLGFLAFEDFGLRMGLIIHSSAAMDTGDHRLFDSHSHLIDVTMADSCGKNDICKTACRLPGHAAPEAEKGKLAHY